MEGGIGGRNERVDGRREWKKSVDRRRECRVEKWD